MIRSWLALVAGFTALISAASSQARSQIQTTNGSGLVPTSVAERRALLDRYCVTCHNQRLNTAGLALDKLDLGDVGRAAETWEKVVRKLETGVMPPAGSPRPGSTASKAFSSWLESALDNAAVAAPNPGRPALHRLNRAEYTNAVRDLLGVEVDGRFLLPVDDSGYGFDNIADVLSVSPGLLERYLSAADGIVMLAVGDPKAAPRAERYAVAKYLLQDDRVDDDLPFVSRGGIAIRRYFPVDGDYVMTVRLQRAIDDVIRGLSEPHQLEVLLDGALVKQFTVGGATPAENGAGQSPSQEVAPRYSEYQLNADAGLEVRFRVKAGMRLIGVTFVKHTSAIEGMLRPPPPVTSWSFTTCGVRWVTPHCEEPGIESVEIRGPYAAAVSNDTPSQGNIFRCRPRSGGEEDGCARIIISSLARRAFRRPVTAADVKPLVRLFDAGRDRNGFAYGIALALRAILVSPQFLFRAETDPAGIERGGVYRLSDIELASRLSFFLWSSIPDEELLTVAERGQLKHPAVLAAQVQRMLNDGRAKALIANFVGQWLYLRNMRAAAPDPVAFPEFDDTLRESLERETLLFVENQIAEDRSVVDLLKANYTFLNERLAKHYGIPNVYGSHFRRVTYSDDRRAGLLGHGSILTVTSYVNRTSPVVRGKWLLENILGAPPPPPPPNVPDLADEGEGGTPASVRERMEQHRRNPVCAACHARMDPLGFALENFDGIGRWRTTEAGQTIDASATLPGGSRFEGPVGLRAILLKDPEQFVTTVAEKLLTYALGRGVEYFDAPAVRTIVRTAARHDYRWSSLIRTIIESPPFQMRRAVGATVAERGGVTEASRSAADVQEEPRKR